MRNWKVEQDTNGREILWSEEIKTKLYMSELMKQYIIDIIKTNSVVFDIYRIKVAFYVKRFRGNCLLIVGFIMHKLCILKIKFSLYFLPVIIVKDFPFQSIDVKFVLIIIHCCYKPNI